MEGKHTGYPNHLHLLGEAVRREHQPVLNGAESQPPQPLRDDTAMGQKEAQPAAQPVQNSKPTDLVFPLLTLEQYHQHRLVVFWAPRNLVI